jgi:CheY-like chemotaxis protein
MSQIGFKRFIHFGGQTACRILGGIEKRESIRNFASSGESVSRIAERQNSISRAVMRRILIVDDDQQVCRAIQIWLKQYGYRVAIADGGNTGLAALDSSTFDLMIVDVIMPQMTGFESIRVFHERAPSIPLIAISGDIFSAQNASDAVSSNLALRLGATRCLRKPFRPAALLGVIDECLSEIEPHRKYIATLAAVAHALSESRGGVKSSS